MDELIAKLEAIEDLLTSYLIDETERGFEEIPQIDEARALTQDAQSIARRL